MESPPPAPRELHGFRRTTCGCEFCSAPCKHILGGLDPADLATLCPPGRDAFAWAEEHLRALTHKPYPTLVPARGPDGACHWYFGGRCAVHGQSPYGCAFFDTHMTREEADRRQAATAQARTLDAAANGLYTRVWRHLCRLGLTERPGDTKGLTAELTTLHRTVERRFHALTVTPP